MSRLRQKFIILNLAQDKEEEFKDRVMGYWHQLRCYQAALHDDSKYVETLKQLDGTDTTPTQPIDEFDKFVVWKLSTPEWIDFEITEEEKQILFGQKLNGS